MEKKRILVVTTRFPFDFVGSCAQDRGQGIVFLRELGYEVHVVAMCYTRLLDLVESAERTFDITITPILFSKERITRKEKLVRRFGQVLNPLNWDGAAYEYRDPETVRTVRTVIETFKPDVVWFDYTYLWPLFRLAEEKKIPIIMRSLNYEPKHFLGQTRKTPMNYLKYAIKAYGERVILDRSDLVFSISPKEKLRYEEMRHHKKVVNLPLRRLSKYIGQNATIHEREKLNIVFMGINFDIPHMQVGLRFIIDEVNPVLQKRFPGVFTFHIVGGRVPKDIATARHEGLIIHGFVPDLDAFLEDMDIAISPSLIGEGMQQKVFEPIARGIPMVTSPRALAGYPFFDKIHVLTATDATSFVEALTSLRSAHERARISENAIRMAQIQFSEDIIKELMDRHVRAVIASHT